eukprot:204988_1
MSHGTIFCVTVTGKFAKLSFFNKDSFNLFVIISPEKIEMVSCDHDDLIKRLPAHKFVDIIRLDDIIENKRLPDLQNTVQRMYPLIGDHLMHQLLDPEKHSDIYYILNLLLVNKENLASILFNINSGTVESLDYKIWLELINNDNVDKTSIIKLRKFFQKSQYENIQTAGKALLKYPTNNILHALVDDIKCIEWHKHIKDGVNSYFFQQNAKNVQSQRSIDDEEQLQTFLGIMCQYDKIVNFEKSNEEKDIEEKKSKKQTSGDEIENINTLSDVFNFIDSKFNMSKIMDVVIDIQSRNIKNCIQIKKQNKCSLGNNCNIFYNIRKTRQHRLLSRALKSEQQYEKQNNHMKLEDFTKMELLNLAHVRLFHKQQGNERILSERRDIVASQLEFEKEILFMDKVHMKNNKLMSFRSYCLQEEYETEGIYDDMFPDNDDQSNIYQHFCNNLPNEINEYYALKKFLFNYTINPADNTAINRNLIELDFGQDVIAWDVKPKFDNIKEEWLHNQYFPIEHDLYQSLYLKSSIISNQQKNKTSYNLSVDDVLCIKMYTDTNELQSNFRHSFRTKSDANRRSQFLHWATILNIVFMKIEVANELYECNQFICSVTLYHGLNRLFDTKTLVNQFNGPLSTTWEQSVAKTFAGDQGMILEIDKGINNKNVNAIEVDWISCHDTEQEILLMNPKVLIQKSVVFTKDVQLKTFNLKNILSTTIIEDTDAFTNLSAFLQSTWIVSCLEEVVKDKEFVQRVEFFLPKKYLNEMNVFEFIFFECGHYQIANYVTKYYDKTHDEIFEKLIDIDSLISMNDDNFVTKTTSVSQLYIKYPPQMLKMNIIYEDDDNNKVIKPFGTKKTKQMLLQTELILQHIDQRQLDEAKHIAMNIEIKYHHRNNDGKKSGIRKWRYKSANFSLTKLLSGNDMNLKIDQDTTFTSSTLCVASLFLTNACHVTCINDIGEFRIICKNNVLIDEYCSISMNECGVKGATYDEEKKQVIYGMDDKHNGASGIFYAGGAGYKHKGERSYGYKHGKGYGGSKYLNDDIMNNNDIMKFSTGFGGGCAKLVTGSKGGDGGGKIIILCDKLIIKEGAKITANGGNGKNLGGGGSGGSIICISSDTDIDRDKAKVIFAVNGGTGDGDAGDGSDGLIQWIYSDKSPYDTTLGDEYLPTIKCKKWFDNILW